LKEEYINLFIFSSFFSTTEIGLIYKFIFLEFWKFIGLLLESVREFSEDDLLSSVLICEFNTEIY
jgi:hypothetical protein